MKTRSTKQSASTARKDVADPKPSTTKGLPPSIEEPPRVFVLPDNTNAGARIATIPHPATKIPTRFYVCPERGFYEFIRVAAPKRECRSWLLTPERRKASAGTDSARPSLPAETDAVTAEKGEGQSGYALQAPDLFIATPIDPLFMALPALAGQGTSSGQEYLAASDYVATLGETSRHLREMLQSENGGHLRNLLESRMKAACEVMDMGDDKLLTLSMPRLATELVAKAKRMSEHGLPSSMEERFVRRVLDVPIINIRREISEDGAVAATVSSATISSADEATAAASNDASVAGQPGLSQEPSVDPAVISLLRQRVAIDFLKTSYIPERLHKPLTIALNEVAKTTVDFSPLDAHLSHLAGLRREAQALRTLSDNISRKRTTTIEDEEIISKKRKREEEEEKKKNVSVGIKKLMKADTTGMKKLSAFFTKKT